MVFTMSSKLIRDPIWRDIMIDGLFMELADTREVQRLRNIKQNGLCYLVYPAMNSTRFEHSLGVYHLAGVLCARLGLEPKKTMELQAASLLHDIGHGPFSHTFDPIFSEKGFDHETRSARIVTTSKIKDILSAHGISPPKVAELIGGGGKLGSILSSDVDVDKMDYLVRDAYYAGVAYGVTDVERLLSSIMLVKDEVVVDESGLEAAESLLINRAMMHQTVYRHHTKRIAESMMQHALSRFIESGADPTQIMASDDPGLVALLRGSSGYSKEIMACIDDRRLFKNVFSEPINSFSEESRQELHKNANEVEQRISDELGIEPGYLLIDFPKAVMSEYGLKIKTKNGLKSIMEISTLAKSLKASEQEKLTLNIYVAEKNIRQFEKFQPQKFFTYTQTRISGYT